MLSEWVNLIFLFSFLNTLTEQMSLSKEECLRLQEVQDLKQWTPIQVLMSPLGWCSAWKISTIVAIVLRVFWWCSSMQLLKSLNVFEVTYIILKIWILHCIPQYFKKYVKINVFDEKHFSLLSKIDAQGRSCLSVASYSSLYTPEFWEPQFEKCRLYYWCSYAHFLIRTQFLCLAFQ